VDINEFERRLKKYRGFKVYGVVAGIKYFTMAIRSGIKVLNEEGFKAKDFSTL